MGTTLYVGNLPWSTTEDDLSEMVSAYTDVQNSRIIMDRETGRSRGFGFVEIPETDVDKVITAINGTQMGGRELVVNEAKPKQTGRY